MLNSGSFLEVITQYLRNTPYCLCYQVDFVFTLNLISLYQSVSHSTERDWRMAQKYLNKGNLQRAKKTIVHSLRVLLISINLAKGEQPVFSSANEYHMELLNIWVYDWEYYENQYNPTIQGLLQNLTNLCQVQ